MLSRGPSVRRRGLGTRTTKCFRGHAQRLWCTHSERCGWQRRGRTHLSHTLPLAVFPHPRRSLCWIAIRHTFTQMRAPCTVYPSTINYLEVRRENCGGSRLEVGTNLLVDPFHLCPLSIRACRLRRHISIPGEIRIPAIRHHRFLRVPRSVFHAGLPW